MRSPSGWRFPHGFPRCPERGDPRSRSRCGDFAAAALAWGDRWLPPPALAGCPQAGISQAGGLLPPAGCPARRRSCSQAPWPPRAPGAPRGPGRLRPGGAERAGSEPHPRRSGAEAAGAGPIASQSLLPAIFPGSLWPPVLCEESSGSAAPVRSRGSLAIVIRGQVLHG